MFVTVPNHMLDQEVLKKTRKEPTKECFLIPPVLFVITPFMTDVTRIVINDETRQTRERYLPAHMWKLLNEVELFVFDGQ